MKLQNGRSRIRQIGLNVQLSRHETSSVSFVTRLATSLVSVSRNVLKFVTVVLKITFRVLLVVARWVGGSKGVVRGGTDGIRGKGLGK